MKNNYKFILLITIICFILIFPGSSLANQDYWEQHYEKAENQYNENPNSLANNYYKTICMANLGMINETMEILDQFKDDFTRDEFDEMFNKEIKKIDQENDEILYLNYYAFYHVIFDEYNAAIDYFEKIIKKDSNNIWPINYKAAALIETKRYEEAHKDLKKSLNIKNNQYTRLLLGVNYYEQGQKLRAFNELRKTGNLISDFIF
ncbi:MAG: tetratricopeptide repeat protein [Bacillota bacterium]